MILRLVFIFAFSIVGLALAIAWQITKDNKIGFAAYAVFFMTIGISEIIICHWRNVRDSTLRPLAAELMEANRKKEEIKA